MEKAVNGCLPWPNIEWFFEVFYWWKWIVFSINMCPHYCLVFQIEIFNLRQLFIFFTNFLIDRCASSRLEQCALMDYFFFFSRLTTLSSCSKVLGVLTVSKGTTQRQAGLIKVFPPLKGFNMRWWQMNKYIFLYMPYFCIISNHLFFPTFQCHVLDDPIMKYSIRLIFVCFWRTKTTVRVVNTTPSGSWTRVLDPDPQFWIF